MLQGPPSPETVRCLPDGGATAHNLTLCPIFLPQLVEEAATTTARKRLKPHNALSVIFFRFRFWVFVWCQTIPQHLATQSDPRHLCSAAAANTCGWVLLLLQLCPLRIMCMLPACGCQGHVQRGPTVCCLPRSRAGVAMQPPAPRNIYSLSYSWCPGRAARMLG